jgi:hypothetical protein
MAVETLDELDASEAVSARRPPARTSPACKKWTASPQVREILTEVPDISGADLGRKLVRQRETRSAHPRRDGY